MENDKMIPEEVENFNYKGYQVVRGEFFSHIYEPCISFNNSKIYVNSACIRKLPETNYIQILVNQEEQKLAIRPCHEEDKDSFRWCSMNAKRSPRQIKCPPFYAKIMNLMDWNPDYRYRLVGKLIRSQGQLLFVFDMKSPEVFLCSKKDDGTVVRSRTPLYISEWMDQFGIPVDEHKSSVQISIFDDYTVFRMENKNNKNKEETKESEETAINVESGNEVNTSITDRTIEDKSIADSAIPMH